MLQWSAFKGILCKVNKYTDNHIEKLLEELKLALDTNECDKWQLNNFDINFLFTLFDNKIKRQYTILHVASDCGCAKIVEALLEKGAYVDIKGDQGNLALHYAMRGKVLEIVDLLLNVNQANIGVQNNQGNTPLHLAARYGRIDFLKKIFHDYRDIISSSINMKNHEGQAALHLAVDKSSQEVVEMLLTIEQIIIGVQDNKGNTPLHIATNKSSPEIVKLLLGQGVSTNQKIIDLQNREGDTVLHCVTCKECSSPSQKNLLPNRIEIIKECLTHNPNVNIHNNNNMAAWQCASRSNNSIIQSLFMRYHGSVFLQEQELKSEGNGVQKSDNTVKSDTFKEENKGICVKQRVENLEHLDNQSRSRSSSSTKIDGKGYNQATIYAEQKQELRPEANCVQKRDNIVKPDTFTEKVSGVDGKSAVIASTQPAVEENTKLFSAGNTGLCIDHKVKKLAQSSSSQKSDDKRHVNKVTIATVTGVTVLAPLALIYFTTLPALAVAGITVTTVLATGLLVNTISSRFSNPHCTSIVYSEQQHVQENFIT